MYFGLQPESADLFMTVSGADGRMYTMSNARFTSVAAR